MRRIAVTLVLPLLAIGLLAGCSGSSASLAASPGVTVTGAFGQNPTIKIPATKATSSLTVKTVIHGSGPTLTKTQAFVGNYAIYIWSGTSHRLAQSSFTAHNPTLFAGQLLPGLEKALVGQKIGSRVLAVIPPKDAFGKSGNPQAGIKGTDTLVFVVDLIKSFARRTRQPPVSSSPAAAARCPRSPRPRAPPRRSRCRRASRRPSW